MDKNMSIAEYLIRYNLGAYDSPDRDIQCDAGWYDWFCKSTALCAKTRKLTSKLKQIVKSSKIDIHNNYVWFKNNCPVDGKLYDDFRIADMKTGDVIYTITPSSGHKRIENVSEVWGKENEFKEPLVSGTWGDVKKFFLEPKIVMSK